METAVANMVREGTHVLVVVNGYFGERLADLCLRYGALVSRVEVPWGRAVDPETRAPRASRKRGADIVAMVHAETSTGVLNPVDAVAEVAREFGCLTLVDAVTSLGAHPVDVDGVAARRVLQLHAEGPGRAVGPRADQLLSARARAGAADRRAAASTSISALLEQYWVDRKYHHTIAAPLVYALREALRRHRRRRTRGALDAASPASPRARRRPRRDGPRAAAARRRAAVDAERGVRARRRRRSGGAPRSARAVQPRDRRRASGRSPAASGASA